MYSIGQKKIIGVSICLVLLLIYFIWFFARVWHVLSVTPEGDLIVMKIVKDEKICDDLVKWVNETRDNNKKIGDTSLVGLIMSKEYQNGEVDKIPSDFKVDEQIGSIGKAGIYYSPLSNAVVLPPDIEDLALGKNRQTKVTISFDSLGFTKIDFDRSCIFVFSPGGDISSIPNSLIPSQGRVGTHPVIGFLSQKNE